MVGRVGRQTRFFFGGNSPGDEIPGVREKSLKMNGEAIDVTSDEDNGYRQLLSNIQAQTEISLGVNGVTKDTRLKEAWVNRQLTQTCRMEYPDGSFLTGTFFLSDYSETEPYKDAATFEATLLSSGIVTFTPAA